MISRLTGNLVLVQAGTKVPAEFFDLLRRLVDESMLVLQNDDATLRDVQRELIELVRRERGDVDAFDRGAESRREVVERCCLVKERTRVQMV